MNKITLKRLQARERHLTRKWPRDRAELRTWAGEEFDIDGNLILRDATAAYGWRDTDGKSSSLDLLPIELLSEKLRAAAMKRAKAYHDTEGEMLGGQQKR